jgi:cytochrome c biogenesis protein CcmG/thiol:disulfide interchange protein DsbE
VLSDPIKPPRPDMPRLTRTTSFLALCLVAFGAVAGEPRAAPPLTATLLDGTRFSLAENAGKVVLINFWATWCEPCRKEMPALEAFYRRYRDRGLVMLAISLDEPGDADVVGTVMRGYTFPAALAARARYGGFGRIWRVPMTFVIDRQGRLRSDLTQGTLQIDEAFLEQRVAPLLEKP